MPEMSEWGMARDWETTLQHWLAIAKEHAAAKAHVTKLEHMRKATIAIAMAESGERSVAAQERVALASKEYIKAVSELAAAVEREQILAARLEAGRLYFDMVRTEAATRRAEMTLR